MYENKKDVKIIDILKIILITIFVLLIYKQMKEYLFFKEIADNNYVIKEKIINISYKKPFEKFSYKDNNGVNVTLSEIFNVKTETEKSIIFSNYSCNLLRKKQEYLYIWPSKEKNYIYLSQEEKSVWRLFNGKVFSCYSFIQKK